MLLRTTALYLTLATTALAEVPQVITDIAPIQSLVARVMDGAGTPDVLLPPGASPHDFALRPSDAARLSTADLVVWVGHGLTPWLENPVQTLAPTAINLELLDTSGWTQLQVRTDPAFAKAEAEAGHEDTEAGHDHAGADPHIWLDPANAAVFMTLTAQALSDLDPENAPLYQANAAAGQLEMAALTTATQAILAPVAGRAYIVPHDAYQYFEQAFGMPAAGAISLTDAATPGPARIAALRDSLTAGDIRCILTDPQTNPDWTGILQADNLAKTAFVDPDGGSQAAELDSMAALYPAIITQMATSLATCLQ
jgi:zinc transport system substrate-binding protein